MQTPTVFVPHFATALRMPARLALAALALLSALSLSAQITYDFNTPGQLDGSFSSTSFLKPNVGTNGVGAQAATGGLGNSGWVANTLVGGDRGYEVVDQTFSGATESFFLSAYFKYESATATAGEALMLGIGRSSDVGVPFTPVGGNTEAIGPASGQSIQVGIRQNPAENQVRAYASTVINGSNANLSFGTTATLEAGNWYFMQVNFSLLAGGSGYDVSVDLYNSSDMGVLGTSLFEGQTTSLTAPLVVAGDVHAFFGVRGQPNTSGITGVDNFTVSALAPVPEPATVALACAAGCVGAVALRRRFRQGK